MLADRGGVIGIHFMTHMLTGRFDPPAVLEDVLRQIDAVAGAGGIDCVALGPDFLPNTLNFKRNTGQSNLSFPIGLEDPSGLPLLTCGLIERGYSDDSVRKILGENLLRLLHETIG
jgi:membrane dipeptidase